MGKPLKNVVLLVFSLIPTKACRHTEGKSQGSQADFSQAFLPCHVDLGLGRAAGLGTVLGDLNSWLDSTRNSHLLG